MGESDERRFSFTRHIPFTLLSLVILSCFAIIFFRRVSFELTTDVPLLSIRGVLNDGNTSNVKSNIVINNTQLEYMKRRNSLVNWDDWLTEDDREVVDDADKNGTVIDFIIAGFPKCGTTTMEANLGNIAPMPIADVCTRLPQTIWYAYRNWPNQFPDKDGRNDTKLYRGTKCPSSINDMKDWSRKVPKAKIIVGIRHPVLWFQSFWNMQAKNNPKGYMGISPYNRTNKCGRRCNSKGCPGRELFCVARSRFHLALARLGKTPLNETERAFLAPFDADGGDAVRSQNVRNSIFLYEQTELNEDDFWESLARSLEYPYPTIPHDKRHSSHGKNKTRDYTINIIDVCEPKYDDFRITMMPYAYEMSRWICDYFVASPGVVVANETRFCSIVRNYEHDPCGRLVRLENGTYVVRDDAAMTNATKSKLRKM